MPRAGAHALLTRPPLGATPKDDAPFDLHVLGAPPAFVLSQDQTLSLVPRTPHKNPQGARASGSNGITCQGRPKRAPATAPVTDAPKGLLKGDRLEPRAQASPRPPTPKGNRRPHHRPRLGLRPATSPECLSQRPKGRRPRIPSKTPPPCPKNRPRPGAKLPPQTSVQGTSGTGWKRSPRPDQPSRGHAM
jgi:hypothetical protein